MKERSSKEIDCGGEFELKKKNEASNPFSTMQSRRRSRLGLGVADWRGSEPWYYRNPFYSFDCGCLSESFFGVAPVSTADKMALLRRVKGYLGMRSVDSSLGECEHLDQRRDWNRSRRRASTLLDFFPSIKYSYSSLLPTSHRIGFVNLVVSDRKLNNVTGGSVLSSRVASISRSHSIWLDPIDSPKELFKYRLRINDCINWAYGIGLVPVMLTLTIPHFWNDLDKLLIVLRKSWSSFFSGVSHQRRSQAVGFSGYIRRLEITLNDSLHSSEYSLFSQYSSSSSFKKNSTKSSSESLLKLPLKGDNSEFTGLPDNSYSFAFPDMYDNRAEFSDNKENNSSQSLPENFIFSGSDTLNFLKNVNTPAGRGNREFLSISDRGRKNLRERPRPVPETNHGWHPHFHAILFVQKDKLKLLSDLEDEWCDAWCKIVCRQFEKVIGQKVPAHSVRAMRHHGFWFSRFVPAMEDFPSRLFKKIYGSEQLVKTFPIRPVKDSEYLAKIMGYDPVRVYGIDRELTASSLKNSKTFFDLLSDEVTASNCDLVCEYAIATKGIPAITFSSGLEKTVAQYFASHPEKKSARSPVPPETLVASIRREVYQILYRNALIPQLLKVATQGYDALCVWLRQVFLDLGLSRLCDDPFALPRPPT